MNWIRLLQAMEQSEWNILSPYLPEFYLLILDMILD